MVAKASWILIGITSTVVVVGLGLGLGLGFGLKKDEDHPDPGDIVQVDTSGTIGVLLEDFPVSTQSSIISSLTTMNDTFWENRVKKQILLVQYRLTFRSTFYPGKKQLMLPLSNAWTIEFTSSPTVQTIEGHQHVARDFTLRTYIIGSTGTAAIADDALSTVGGIVFENYTLPVDPQLLMQRTGYACMDENLFPHGSLDPESPHIYFDDSCTAGEPDILNANTSCLYGCHCTQGADLDCSAAISTYIGTSETALMFTRLPWNETLAQEIEALNEYQIREDADGADLEGMRTGVEHNWIVYRYFTSNTCEADECLSGIGWRRLLIFDTLDLNIGNTDINMGEINYVAGDQSSFNSTLYHNLYYWDECHHHPHFAGYANYSFSGTLAYKQGFCIQDVVRVINTREVGIAGTFDTCGYQGVSSGWADEYNGGIPCQWVDITDIDTSSGPFTSGGLEVYTNPREWICEGTVNKDADGNDLFVPTGEVTDSPPYDNAGESIDKWSCNTMTGAIGNDDDIVPMTLPVSGEGLLTSECIDDGQVFGPKRDCEFAQVSALVSCTANTTVSLTCTNSGTQAQVVRFCESSIALQAGTACRYMDDFTLNNTVVLGSGGTAPVTFTCPAARDATEVGGKYSVYGGLLYNNGTIAANAVTVTCV